MNGMLMWAYSVMGISSIIWLNGNVLYAPDGRQQAGTFVQNQTENCHFHCHCHCHCYSFRSTTSSRGNHRHPRSLQTTISTSRKQLLFCSQQENCGKMASVNLFRRSYSGYLSERSRTRCCVFTMRGGVSRLVSTNFFVRVDVRTYVVCIYTLFR